MVNTHFVSVTLVLKCNWGIYQHILVEASDAKILMRIGPYGVAC